TAPPTSATMPLTSASVLLPSVSGPLMTVTASPMSATGSSTNAAGRPATRTDLTSWSRSPLQQQDPDGEVRGGQRQVRCWIVALLHLPSFAGPARRLTRDAPRPSPAGHTAPRM